MSSPDFAVIILAAGQGTRMRSDTHKVLHPIAGKPMFLHLLDMVDSIGASRRVVVVGKGREQIEAALEGRGVSVAVQAEQKGTAHAVRMAEEALADFDGPVVVLYGDTPFVTEATLRRMLERLGQPDDPGIVVLASSPQDGKSYGRVILEGGDRISKMVEYKDANEAERAVKLCNSGMLAAGSRDLFRWLASVGADNAAHEYYLPDAVMVAKADGRHPVAIEGEAFETAGVNSRAELAHLELDWQRRRREEALDQGATLIDPDSVWFSHDTKLGRDSTVEPHVVFGPGVTIADGAVIRAFCHIEGATIATGCEVGPFARLRPGTTLGKGARIGNFVEVKKTALGEGAKVNHLSYIGDAEVGAKANVGAGTITCNYDGFGKYRTQIGAGAFIGSNSALVAPVSIGAGAIVGAGSVVTKDVAADELAVARGEQTNKSGWAARFRSERQAKKEQR
ncbi:bifunctional UDP-N-acetylglucosamine diphosphorylase/glucosamine-1-phosphate N-acetyltransferase GlmU [Sphingomonas sp. LY29]|uniref:bifunctional UDP-N-acetylglucosamine diphosphorylase/glucosamine-1-phosphate N-acetyltransferase GlmU n=1 Tax=unclassified Sphingomonas TaxID=196159 RepID=UPI002ADEE70A|nr:MULTISPECIES: bifunctional UDP-N-acetylglucosamine diphosphorylase/glucosamine-1-phosphate N-acetyltransferase GlmU [unclassified Sphingomonas]MEA1071576.1 bifunctional UDP-N-acetylglucosamine diphosphorylase/glucosamine-1-phosphate N-acetyltransferase GlmU [Sphingomonas sp. LY160]WRP25747.1 bifunctional UDP-N-acetylglucosamine diphosphorylase/glucosamine-1-phosphate N-acetyltransferase GlmU [Sphingomonas sp. LY29]